MAALISCAGGTLPSLRETKKKRKSLGGSYAAGCRRLFLSASRLFAKKLKKFQTQTRRGWACLAIGLLAVFGCEAELLCTLHAVFLLALAFCLPVRKKTKEKNNLLKKRFLQSGLLRGFTLGLFSFCRCFADLHAKKKKKKNHTHLACYGFDPLRLLLAGAGGGGWLLFTLAPLRAFSFAKKKINKSCPSSKQLPILHWASRGLQALLPPFSNLARHALCCSPGSLCSISLVAAD